MLRAIAIVTLLVPAGVGAVEPDLPTARDRQAAVQADTEQLARRVGAMLRVMEHYKLDPAGERKVLEEAANTLAGLSKNQMAEVLSKLDAAMQSADSESAQKQIDAAYAGHRESLRKLKNLLGRYDAIRDLDVAAQRLDKLARDQLEMCFRVGDILQDSLDSASTDPARRRRIIKSDFPTNRARREAEEHVDHQREFDTAVKQLAVLRSKLRADQRERLERAEYVIKSRDISRTIGELAVRTRPEGTIERRHRDWTWAGDQAWSTSGAIQETALALKAPREKLQTLKESRSRVASVLEQLGQDGAAMTAFFTPAPAPEVGPQQPQRNPRGGIFFMRMIADDPWVSRARQFADGSGKLAFTTRGVQYQLAALAPPVAAGLGRAAQTLRLAEQATRQYQPLFAITYTRWAESQLQLSLSEIDALVVQAEKERGDALEATKAAIQQVEELIAEQKAIAAETGENIAERKTEAARQQASQQHELAKRTREIAQTPLATPPKTRDLIKEAAGWMQEAGKDLEQRRPDTAKKEQDQAIAKLEEAKKDLEKAAEKIEQRREEVKQLEAMREKLGTLTEEQKKVAEQAKQAAKSLPKQDETAAESRPDPVALEKAIQEAKKASQDQQKMTPPTREMAKDLEGQVPEVAKEVAKAAEKMEKAKNLLNDEKIKDGADRSDRAVKDLQRADRMLNDEIAKRKAQELLDQSKLQQEDIDPAQAAKELAKALEQTDLAKQASELAKNNPAAENLAMKQEELAKLAEQLGKDKIAEMAKQAAKELKQGDLQNALNDQQKALAEMLRDAPKSELPKDQKVLMEATKQLAQSQEATTMAQEALKQAMANSPDAFKQPLEQAAQKLDQAGQELKKGNPGQANKAQGQAMDSLDQLMMTLAQAAAMAEQMQQQIPPGQNPSEQPGEQPGQNPADPDLPNGDNPSPQPPKTEKAQLNPGDAEGRFLHLPPRQRELIKQALTEKLPPEYSNLIQQYFVNLAKGKPATKPSSEPSRKDP